MQEEIFITTWNQFKAYKNDDRRRIINECFHVPKSIKELSICLTLNPGSVFNHVNKLLEHGYIAIESTKVVNGIVEKKYRTTAKKYTFALTEPSEIDRQDRYIAFVCKREIEKILRKDKSTGTAKVAMARLSEKNVKIFQQKLQDLRDFFLNNDESDGIHCTLVTSFGVVKEQ